MLCRELSEPESVFLESIVVVPELVLLEPEVVVPELELLEPDIVTGGVFIISPVFLSELPRPSPEFLIGLTSPLLLARIGALGAAEGGRRGHFRVKADRPSA